MEFVVTVVLVVDVLEQLVVERRSLEEQDTMEMEDEEEREYDEDETELNKKINSILEIES